MIVGAFFVFLIRLRDGQVRLARAMILPSVVGLWYAVGSAVIPGLLLPLLGVYFPDIRVPRKFALASSLSGFIISGLYVAFGDGGVQPMYPGLIASIVVWGAGLLGARPSRSRP